jgi:hypothetical protein
MMHLAFADFWRIIDDHAPPPVRPILERQEHQLIARLSNCFVPLSIKIDVPVNKASE